MHEILFAGHELKTTDAVAALLVEYAALIAESGRVDVVEFPFVDGGRVETCRLLLTPYVQLAVATVAEQDPQMPGADAAFLALSDKLTTARRNTR
jgi:hypothetical protein